MNVTTVTEVANQTIDGFEKDAVIYTAGFYDDGTENVVTRKGLIHLQLQTRKECNESCLVLGVVEQ